MKSTRQPKLGIALRICAGLSLFAWLWASSLCATESLFGHSHDNSNHEYGTAEHQEHDAEASPSAAGHSHNSGNGEEGHSCCSTIQTALASAGSIAFLKPDFGKPLSLQAVLLTQALALIEPEVTSTRQAKQRERVFTPEVYLGPAFRAHAPPLFI